MVSFYAVLQSIFSSFYLIDTDHDGFITFEEFKSYLKKIFPTISDKDVRRIFDCIDHDGDGLISIEDIIIAIHRGKYNKPHALEKIFNTIDTDADGYLSEDEFRWKPQAQEEVEMQQAQELIEQRKSEMESSIFDVIDTNRSGYITKDEVKVLMKTINETVTDEVIDKTIAVVDLDGDKKLSFGEFSKYMLREIDDGTDSILDAFDNIDIDHDGFITLAEMKILFAKFSSTTSEEEVKEIFDSFDFNGDGLISRDEFSSIMQVQMSQPIALKEMFDDIDTNGNGYISRDEVTMLMKKINETVTDEEIDEMITVADLNGDKKLSFEEFKIFFANL